MTVRSVACTGVPGHCARVGSGDLWCLASCSSYPAAAQSRWTDGLCQVADTWGRGVRLLVAGGSRRGNEERRCGLGGSGSGWETRRDAAAGATGPRLPRRIRAGWIGWMPGSNDLGGGGGRAAAARQLVSLGSRRASLPSAGVAEPDPLLLSSRGCNPSPKERSNFHVFKHSSFAPLPRKTFDAGRNRR
nr:unnamed protein product [Digitaria exilis]